MKKIMLTMVLVSIAMLLQAQEVMKVDFVNGETVEYKVDDIKKVYFETKTPGNEDDITTNYLIMYVGDKKEIEGTVITATSENEFVASVTGSTVKANHVGATFIMVNENHPVLIFVYSKYTSIPDPVLKWGAPKDTIKTHHKKGTIDKDEANTLTYKNCGDALLIGYTFDDNNKLNAAIVGVSSSKSTLFLNYLLDRYLIIPEMQSDGCYLGADAYDTDHMTTVIMYYPSDNYCIYIPYSKNNSRETISQKARELIVEDE